MLRISTARLPVCYSQSPLRWAAGFHSSQYCRILDAEASRSSTSTDSPPPNLTPAARRRLQPDPDFTSSPSPVTPGPNPISPPPDHARIPPKRRVITSVTELPPSFGRNQIIEVPQEVENDLQDVLRAFKKSPVRFAFAYGSGVFRQKGYTPEVGSCSARTALSIVEGC